MATNAGSIKASVELEFNKLSNQIRSVNTKLDQFSDNSKKRGDEFAKGWSGRFGKFNLAGVAAFAGVTAAIKGSVGTFATFEQSLANVASVAGATGSELKLLEDTAREMGETTRFTATQAADALYNLASAGLDAAESAAALEGVLNLAGATGSDLAFTSATMTATLSQFGIAAKDSGDVANIFAAAIANSQANMDKLSNAFRQVGPVAAGLGISLEETTGALQILFNAGFRGENAGLALKSALADLASIASPVNVKLKSMGVNINALGAASTIAEKFGILSKAGLDTGQVIDAFGKIAGPQVLTLLNAGQAGIEEYTAAVTDTTKASELYAIQNDTLQGSIDASKSAVESLAISVGGSLSPALRPLVDLFASFIRFIGKVPKSILALITTFVGLAASLTGVSSAAALLGVALPAAFGPIGLIVAGVAAAIVGLVSVMSDGETAAEKLADATKSLSKDTREYDEIVNKLEKNQKNLTDAEKTLLQLRKQQLALNAADSLAELSKSYTELKERVKDLSSEEQKAWLARALESAKAAPVGSDSIFAYEKSRRARIQEIADLELKNNKELVESQKTLTSSVLDIAKAYNTGLLGIETYKDTNRDLYDEIIRVAEQLKVVADNVDDTANVTGGLIAVNSDHAKSIREIISAMDKYQEKLAENRAAILEEQGLYETATAIRLTLLADEKAAVIDSIKAKSDAIRKDINDNIKNEVTRGELLLELKNEQYNELAAVDDFYAQKRKDLEDQTQQHIQDKNKETANKIISVAEQINSATTDLITSYGEYKLSQYEKGTKEYQTEARKQFRIQKALKTSETVISGAKGAIASYTSMVEAVPGPPGVALGIAAAAATIAAAALQVGTIQAQNPPSFQTGGIVPGTSYSGDNVDIRTNSGELILNDEQIARTLFEIANGGGVAGSGNDKPIVIMLDGSVIYNGLLQASQDGIALVDSRAIVGN